MKADLQARGRAVRLPAEWEPHRACWVAWPSHAPLWRRDLEGARREFAAMCAAIRGERIECLVLDDEGAAEAQAALAGLEVRVHRACFGDIWLRDTGPVTVVDVEGRSRAAAFRFNGWGGKYRLDGDTEVAAAVAELRNVALRTIDITCEGGALETDGRGTLLTTRQCVLNRNRNPGLGGRELEDLLARELGIRKVVWLDRGLVNDHTDGHIDTLARFVAPGRVLCMEAREDSDPNRVALERVGADLRGARDASGQPFEVVRIPSPGWVAAQDGSPMPASYLNFYIANDSVVVPVYGSDYDRAAVEGIAECFPERAVVGVGARSILTGGGAFHCITLQEFRAGSGAIDAEETGASETNQGE